MDSELAPKLRKIRDEDYKKEVVLKKRDEKFKVIRRRRDKMEKLEQKYERRLVGKPEDLKRIVPLGAFIKKAKERKHSNNRTRALKRQEAETPNSEGLDVPEGEVGSVLLVLRNFEKTASSYVQKEAVKSLGLLKWGHARLVRNDAANLREIRLAGNYVCYGFLRPEILRLLFQKVATLQAPEAEGGVVLIDNRAVEERLGDAGMLCSEDLVREILGLGEAGPETLERILKDLGPMDVGNLLRASRKRIKWKRVAGLISGDFNERLALLFQ